MWLVRLEIGSVDGGAREQSCSRTAGLERGGWRDHSAQVRQRRERDCMHARRGLRGETE